MIKILNNDCMNIITKCRNNEFDLAIVDPPYFDGPNKSGYYGKGYSSLGITRERYHDTLTTWDIPTREYFTELKRISKNQIIWGANHFADRFNAKSSCWIIWNKDNGNSSFADVEMAYTSFNTAARMFTYLWNGMHQGTMGGDTRKNVQRIHPTQKPVQLYDWILKTYSKPGQKIIDTHLGSGSSAVAAYYYKVDFLGIELDPIMYQKATNRINLDISQQVLF